MSMVKVCELRANILVSANYTKMAKKRLQEGTVTATRKTPNNDQVKSVSDASQTVMLIATIGEKQT